MTWDGLIMRVYVNGAEASRATLIGTAKTAAGPLRIGGNAIWPEFFKGTIDEVRIYDRALTAAEIVRARDSAITPGAPQPRAHETTQPGQAAQDQARRPPRHALAQRRRRRCSTRVSTITSTIPARMPPTMPGSQSPLSPIPPA